MPLSEVLACGVRATQAEQQRSEWRVGTYVRLHGNLRSFDNQRSIVAYHVRPVTDFNEVRHLLT